MDNEAKEDLELQAISQGLHQLYDPVLEEPVPARLRMAPSRRWRAASIAAGWVAIGIGAGFCAGWYVHGLRPVPAAQAEVPSFVKRAAMAHATYSPEVRHPVEVGADQEQHLVAWLSKRLGAQVRVPKLDGMGFNLVGGRLLPGDNGPVAHFMYQTDKGRRITLYVRTEAAENRETAFRFSAEGNVKVFYWIDRKMGYALSSADLTREDMLAVADTVYRQLNP